MEASKLAGVLQRARQLINPDLTVQQLMLLALVFDSGVYGIDQGSLVMNHGVSRSNVSKIVADLSALTSRKTQGPGLLESRIDPADLRIRVIVCTPKGTLTMAQVLGG